MITYAQIMRYFWLVTSFVIFIGVTYYGIKEGFENWWYNYIFAFIALFAFILRSFMIRRMKKHMAYLNEKKSESESQSTQH
jgi:membrane protein YdbS with pleckstrin-like domain